MKGDQLFKWTPEAINRCEPEGRVKIMNMLLARIDELYDLLQSVRTYVRDIHELKLENIGTGASSQVGFDFAKEVAGNALAEIDRLFAHEDKGHE